MSFENLTEGQQEAFIRCADHIVNRPVGEPLKLDAPGGYGKTWMLRELIRFLFNYHIRVSVVAYVGRAASQLSRDGITASTIHSLLYSPILDANGDILRWERRNLDEIRKDAGQAIIIDEGSMVPPKLFADLQAVGLPLVIAGDTAQLEAITGPNEPTFCALDPNDVPGETITLGDPLRQSSESGIFQLCTHLRETNSIPRVRRDDVIVFPKKIAMSVSYFKNNHHDIVVCGTNKTRKKINGLIRTARGYAGDIPEVGETVMCLKNTVINHTKINNGELFEVEGITQTYDICLTYLKSLDHEGKKVVAKVHADTWLSEQPDPKHHELPLFAFGYAVTAHKIQGSSVKDVLFIDENVSFFLDQQKFRYTACSRASQRLSIGV